MKIAQTNSFKLDSNIDGTYIDSENNVLTISNMIQVVGAADGPVAYPGVADPEAPFTVAEIQAFSDFEDLTVVTNNVGHGLLYDDEGRPYAHKGELVFRDGQGNVASLSRLISNVNSIFEEGATVYLRDKSLQEFNTSDLGVSLDQLINRSIENASSFNSGNIVQAARNRETFKNGVSVLTVNLSENNVVWIAGHALVNEPTQVQVRDVSTDTVLTTGWISPESNNYAPVNVSWVGTLEVLDEETQDENGCSSAIWDAFNKKFFVIKEDALALNIHELALETVVEGVSGSEPGNDFLQGTINIVCIDNTVDDNTAIENGEVVFDNTDSVSVEFDTEMPNDEYSINLQSQEYNQLWYTDKSTKGFTVRSERTYTGSCFWTAIYVE